MRRTASEVIRELEMRVARLEKQANIEDRFVLITRRGKALYLATPEWFKTDMRQFMKRHGYGSKYFEDKSLSFVDTENRNINYIAISEDYDADWLLDPSNKLTVFTTDSLKVDENIRESVHAHLYSN